MRLFSMAFVFILLIAICFEMASSNVGGLMDLMTIKQQGAITIVNRDARTKEPISNTEFAITKPGSPDVLQSIVTDNTGKAISESLDYGQYEIKQTKVVNPYKPNVQPFTVDIKEAAPLVNTKNDRYAYVTKMTRAADGHIDILGVRMDMDALMQNPELPNGCEITSLTAVLHYYGFNVSKTKMSDDYLAKQPFVTKDKKRYGANPSKAYAGDPRDKYYGFFSYAPPIVEAANRYLKATGRANRASDISGSSREEIMKYLKEGIPVLTWVTLDLGKPNIKYSWYFKDTGEYFKAPINLHVVVLNGYDEDEVYAMNPLKGEVSYDEDDFFDTYEDMGNHAMIVGKKT